ncbi:MAG: DNA methyltransferase, partial [bacterium]
MLRKEGGENELKTGVDNMNSSASSIRLADIVFDAKIYPRTKPSSSLIEEYADALAFGAQFPPLILEKDTNRLLDGYHRWKAYGKYQERYQTLLQQVRDDDSLAEPPDEISCEFHEIPEGIEPKLYALYLSSRNGARPTAKEKEEAAQEQYKAHPGASFKLIAKYAGVSVPSVRAYLKPLIAEFEETKRSIIMRLDALGWTQEEVSERLKEIFPDAKGVSQQSIAQFLPENETFHFLVKADLDKGHTSQTIAKRNNLPEILVQGIALANLPDDEKFDRLSIKIQPYDVWNFTKCHELFGNEYPGRIPGELIAHVLYFFTEPGSMVLDPMAGSGTTLDVCLAMGRKCYAYDIDNKYQRPDIIKHDLAKDGWPERVKKANLIFWDPPYFEKIENRPEDESYVEGSISKLSRQEYLDFFATRLHDASALV